MFEKKIKNLQIVEKNQNIDFWNNQNNHPERFISFGFTNVASESRMNSFGFKDIGNPKQGKSCYRIVVTYE